MERFIYLWRRAGRAVANPISDGELLDRFVRHGDEAAFAELVGRHGPLVYGVCRQLLPDASDAEDAFQATFLVLVRRPDRPLGPWLHQVAVWTARNLRRRNAVRLAVVRRLAEIDVPAPPETASAAVEAQIDVHAALAALPRKYRVPLVLCYLQGKTRREAADHLGCTESALSSRLGRGLAMLRKRWAGRDVGLALGLIGVPAVPAGLVASTMRAAVLLRTGSLSSATGPVIADLARGVLRMFWLRKLVFVGTALTAAAVIGFGAWGGPDDGHAARAQPVVSDERKAVPDQVDEEIARLQARIKVLEEQKRWAATDGVVPVPDDLVRAYYFHRNEAAADERYLGKRVRLTGYSWEVVGVSGGPGKPKSYLLTMDYPLPAKKDAAPGQPPLAAANAAVAFRFDAQSRNALAALKRGQTITVEGVCAGRTGEVDARLVFTDCKIIEVPKP